MDVQHEPTGGPFPERPPETAAPCHPKRVWYYDVDAEVAKAIKENTLHTWTCVELRAICRRYVLRAVRCKRVLLHRLVEQFDVKEQKEQQHENPP